MKRFASLSILLFVGVVCFFSCKKEAPKDTWTDTLTTGYIKVACDEDFKPLMEAAVQSFVAYNPAAFISPVYTTEKEAIRLLSEDSVRFALVTRDMYPQEKVKLTEKGMQVTKHLVAFDGVAVIMNRANPDSIIGLPSLRKILTGEITEWSQIYPESRYGTIRTIFNNTESGVLRYVADSLLRGESRSSNLYALANNAEVIQRVAEMPNSIGIVGVNIFSNVNSSGLEYIDQIRMMRISRDENPRLENSYLPYAGDIAQENYPLWRPVYGLLSDPRSGLSAGFSIFLANEVGQKVILKTGLMPVTDPYVMRVIINDEYPN
ncbi:MAG: substrate-binding domain-containing protein [Bacteroidales bacterium]|nr:substrate-binding domain-containing protein [Bacteroidales bacterium]